MTKITENYPCKPTSTSIQSNSAFNIVYIAYSEVSAMSGSKDQNGSGEGADQKGKEYESMGRISKIPLVESTALAMSNLYSSVKQSHCVVQTMFENVEDGWNKSAEAVSPVTTKIEETLEGPLRVIDSAACLGLDYIEEKIPSVKLPPGQIYEKSKDYLNHRVFVPVVNFTSTMVENFREILSHYAKSPGGQDMKENGDDSCSKIADVAKNNK